MSWLFDMATWVLSVIKARWIMFVWAAVIFNGINFVNAYLTSLSQHLFSLTWDTTGAGSLYYTIMSMMSTIMPGNAKAVFALVITLKVTKTGLRIYLILQKYYYDAVYAMNK